MRERMAHGKAVCEITGGKRSVAVALLATALALLTMAIATAGASGATTVTTTLSGEGKEGETITVLEGAGVKDHATLKGTSGKPTGTVKYNMYSNKECKELLTKAGEVTVSGGSVPASNTEKMKAGTYFWQANYKGDEVNQPGTSTCNEIETVKASTSLTTLLLGEKLPRAKEEGSEAEEEEPEKPYEGTEITVAEGAAVGDTAKLSGTDAVTAGGTVKYDLYADKECKKLTAEAGEQTISEGVLPESNEVKLAAGTYYWQARYSGDSLNEGSTSTCGAEVATVMAATSLTTTLSGEGREGEEITVTEGAEVSDKATLSGTDAAMATGTVKYALYSDYKCTELAANAGEVKVAGELVPASNKEKLTPGDYFWQASYSGDSVNHSTVSACGAEISIVTPRLTTSLSGEGEAGEQLEVVEGAGISDKARLHGENAGKATGTVKYALYSDGACKSLVTKAGEVKVSGESVPSSSDEKLTQGTYYWQAGYSGDANNPAYTTVCGTETADITTSTSLSTSLAGEGKKGGKIEVATETPAGDEATLSGANASKAEGEVEYNVYSDSECKELAALAGEVKVASGTVPASEQEKLTVGTYYWRATYLGDSVNHTSTSTCGSEVETVTTPITIASTGEGRSGTEIEVAEGAAVSAKATLHGENAGKATGTVKYRLYADGSCKELVAGAGEVTVSGASVPASNAEKLAGGVYYWQAEYSGDTHNPAAKTACSEGYLQVRGPTYKKYAALGDSYSAGVGAGNYYRKTTVSTLFTKNECYRTERAWPALVASAIFGTSVVTEADEVLKQQPPSFIFRSCNGAVIENLWNEAEVPTSGQFMEWISDPHEEWIRPRPAQALWLEEPGGEIMGGMPNRAINLVTLTIGGNDSGFAAVINACVQPNAYILPPPNNRAQECLEATLEWEQAERGRLRTFVSGTNKGGVPSIIKKLPVVLSKIHLAAPNARIRVALYPRLLRVDRRVDIPVGLAEVINNSGSAQPTSADSLEHLGRKINQEISRAITSWSTAHPGVYARPIVTTVDAFAPTAEPEHLLGNEEPWVNMLALGHVYESFHPNCRGQVALATQVVRVLGLQARSWICP
jgi:hypothetical protein